MKYPKQRIVIVLFSALFVCLLACSDGDTTNPPVKIIAWRCARKEGKIVCDLKARKDTPGDFISMFHPEFRDETGNIVDTCQKCKQKNSNSPSGSDKEVGNMVMVFALASDDTLYNIIATVPDLPEIRKYRFQFTDEASNKVISNTVEGTVFEPQ